MALKRREEFVSIGGISLGSVHFAVLVTRTIQVRRADPVALTIAVMVGLCGCVL